jgi:hypothetical protein
MTYWLLAALLLSVPLGAAAAEKVEPPAKEAPASEALDAEFLEYLATFEGEDADWTWFADDTAKPAQAQTQSDAKQAQSTAKPAAPK